MLERARASDAFKNYANVDSPYQLAAPAESVEITRHFARENMGVHVLAVRIRTGGKSEVVVRGFLHVIACTVEWTLGSLA